MNRFPRIAIAALFLVTALSASLPQGAAEDTDEDGKTLVHLTNWSVGDHWRWQKEPTPQSKSGTAGSIYMSVTGQELARMGLWEDDKHEEWHQKHMTWTTKTWANQTANSPEGPAAIKSEQTRYYKTDDLGLVAIDAKTTYGFPENPAASYGSESRTENFPPRLEMQFPFAIGDEWRVRSYPLTLQKDCDPEESQRPCKSKTNRLHHYEVLRTEPMKIKLNGEYETLRTYVILVKDLFRFDDPDYPKETWFDVVWYAPEVCNYVKKETHKADGTKLYIETLKDYRCGARETGDPTYSGYSYENFSSTRFNEEGIYVHDDLANIYDRASDGDSGDGIVGGELWTNMQEAPGVSPLVLISALALLVGLVGRGRPGRPRR